MSDSYDFVQGHSIKHRYRGRSVLKTEYLLKRDYESELGMAIENLWVRFVLFLATAVAEILGCYLPYLWWKEGRSWVYSFTGLICLALFSWLLTLHPVGAGRTYAAYGGVYIAVAVLWMRFVEQRPLLTTDLIGAAIVLIGSFVILVGPVVNQQE